MGIERAAVRVAAVAAAMVEDCTPAAAGRGGGASGRRAGRRWWEPIELVLGLIHDERLRQGEKWGDRRRTPAEWLMVLAGEVGELAEAVADPDGEGADPQPSAVRQLLRAAGREAGRCIADHPRPGADR